MLKGLFNRNFKNNKFGLSGVIEALLLVALVAVILSTIQIVYVPEIMKQKESDHLDTVENQFSQLKSTIETQCMMGVIQQDQRVAYSPMSSIISLGTKKLPYFVTSNSFGGVLIKDREDTNSRIELEENPTGFLDGIDLCSVEYSFYTMYSSYDPKYILEGGGIILNQTGSSDETGEVMRVNPAITVENNSDSIKIYYTIPVFNCPEGKKNIQGLDEAYIRTNFTKAISYPANPDAPGADIPYIHIYSDHLDAWYNCLMKDSEGLLWEYHNHDPQYINVEPPNEFDNFISITPIEKMLRIDFTIVTLGIQTGYGTVI